MRSSPLYIDVREHNEFEAEHVDGSINIPLSLFDRIAPNFLRSLTTNEVCVMCHAGVRAQQAIAMAQQLNMHNHENLRCYPGGLLAWKYQGNTTQRAHSRRATLPIMRQVQLMIGALVLLFGVLGYWLNPLFSVLAAALGLGVLIAGATGNCAIASCVAKLPWNRRKRAKFRA